MNGSDPFTVAPGPQFAAAPPPQGSLMPPPEPIPSGVVGALSSQVDAVVATCANSSSPICFNTAISGANLLTNLWISAMLGALCYIGFVFFRGRFNFYQARLHMTQVTHRPPKLKLSGLARIWSWLLPVFRVSDEELLLSAGLDALVSVRILSFGVLLFLPITIAAMAILIPLNFIDNYYLASGATDTYTTVFIRLTMSNLTPGTPIMWVHFFFVYGVVFYACWLITEHYKEYIALRQAYVVRSTALPQGTSLGGSVGMMHGEAAPLLTSRSPLNRKHALAKAATMGGSSGFGSDGGGSPRRLSGIGEWVHRGVLRLPRREASGSEPAVAEAALPKIPEGSGDSSPSASPKKMARPSRLSTAATVTSPRPAGVDISLREEHCVISSSPTLESKQQHQQQHQPSRRGGGAANGGGGDAPPGLPLPPTSPGVAHRGGSGGTGMKRASTLFPAVPAAGGADIDWTVHDFSQDVFLPPPGSAGNPHPLSPSKVSGAGLAPAASFPSGRPGQLVRQPSNAAVAAALDPHSHTNSAAEALARIRHHRVLSGASNPTPVDGNSPRPGGGDFLQGGDNAGNASASHPSALHRSMSLPQLPSTEGSPTRQSAVGAAGLPPADLLGIIQAVAVEANGGTGLGDGELGTSGSALSSDIASPHGQDGVAQRWWRTLSGFGNRMERRRSRQHGFPSSPPGGPSGGQSITLKGAVQLGPAPGTEDSFLACNASLYTVLVTDQPIERLRLKRPLGNLEFWHQKTTPFADPTAAAAGRDPLSGLHPTSTEEISEGGTPLAGTASALSSGGLSRRRDTTDSSNFADVEVGLGGAPSGAAAAAAGGKAETPQRSVAAALRDHPDVSERGMGLSAGWSATWHGVRQWWKHRGRYKEWRRDVRWAMFNKRVRTATEMFSELFGDDFDAIIPIYPTQSVEKIIREWDGEVAALERLQYRLKEVTGGQGGQGGFLRKNPAAEDSKVVRLKAKIAALTAKTAALQAKIAAERDNVLSDLPSTCFFATFKSQEAAAVAAQANLNPITQRLFDVQAAPSPDDVNWPALERSWWQRQARPAYVVPLILLIMLLPIGAFTGAFAQLTIAFCGSPADPGPAADNWFCSSDRWAVFIRNLLTSIAPSVVLSIYHMVILPVLVYYAAQAEGRCMSLSSLDRRCAELFFYWDVFNVFLGAMLGGSLLAELPQYLDNPQYIWTTLSSAIPASSNFFINYVSYRALVMAWFRLFYPHQAIITSLFKWAHILPWAKTPRDKALEAPVRNCRYGRDIGIPVLMNFVMVLAYAIVSPLILPFGLIYFALLWAVWRYQMLYVYQRQYESGGQFWPLVAHKVVGCLLLLVLFTSVVLILKQGYAQAAIILATLPLYLLRFDTYLTNRYDAVVAQVPLMAVHKAGRVSSVDPDLWTPPPLRQGARGWNPEWGKVWQWWGVPRYTL